jgi:hypothetical protein
MLDVVVHGGQIMAGAASNPAVWDGNFLRHIAGAIFGKDESGGFGLLNYLKNLS